MTTAPTLFDRSHQPATKVPPGSSLYLAYWRGFGDARQGAARVVVDNDPEWQRYYDDGRRLGALVRGFAPKTRRMPDTEAA